MEPLFNGRRPLTLKAITVSLDVAILGHYKIKSVTMGNMARGGVREAKCKNNGTGRSVIEPPYWVGRSRCDVRGNHNGMENATGGP